MAFNRICKILCNGFVIKGRNDSKFHLENISVCVLQLILKFVVVDAIACCGYKGKASLVTLSRAVYSPDNSGFP
jgi:hypothetical protein